MLIVGYKLQTRTDYIQDLSDNSAQHLRPTGATVTTSSPSTLLDNTYIDRSLYYKGGALAIEFMMNDAEPGAPVGDWDDSSWLPPSAVA